MFGQFNFEDAVAGGFFTLASLVSTGIMAITFLPEDIALSSAAWTVEGADIILAFLIALGALRAVYMTNRITDVGGDLQGPTRLHLIQLRLAN